MCTGPMANDPGFGTIGETLSGFAFRNGDPDSPPLLPPVRVGRRRHWHLCGIFGGHRAVR
ncbi:hypothetical protein ROP_70860 [Rhodococcus opacus B4]|uniref:Uncharacterized protein n=1 Tax=Rhodococcus opacus (strain B4) TaxID=632772 RepID=C1B5S2_RHOOB|nr:hypothetical protein ROP_70860 [Rhodococcus opacus B4]